MKYLIFPLLLISFKAYSCANKIDESKVMLFVDTNFSDLEIDTASRAACQRGEKLVILPRNYKEYSGAIRTVEATLKKLNACTKNCEKLASDYQNAYQNLSSKSGKDFSFKNILAQELESIKKNNGKLSNFIISGHDGGGYFGGHKGSIERAEIAQLMIDYEDINEVSTLMLLGCYTGVQNEIIHWKGIFPKVKMIGGYDGSAPLSDKPMGHQYLEDLLVKEKGLLKQADEKKLNEYVKSNIRGLNSMHTAVYLEPLCEETTNDDNAMYYGSLTNKKFAKFDLGQCAKEAATINHLQVAFSRFDSGEVEPPKSPSDPSIKTLYDKARSLEHCIRELSIPLDVNALFNLRFYHGVKENFSTYYKNDLNLFAKIMEEEKVNWNNLEKELDEELLNIDKFSKKIEEENEKITADPQGFFHQLRFRLNSNNQELDSMLNDPVKLATLNRVQDPSHNPSFEETMLYSKYTALKESINDDNSKLMYTANPQNLVAMNRMKVSEKISNISVSKENLKILKENKIWSPTAENLQKNSRKELRENLHRIDSLLTIANLPRKTRLALEWASQAQQQHFVHFQNPFEWHEVTAQVSTPAAPVRMAQEIYRHTRAPAGYLGGFNTDYQFSPGLNYNLNLGQ